MYVVYCTNTYAIRATVDGARKKLIINGDKEGKNPMCAAAISVCANLFASVSIAYFFDTSQTSYEKLPIDGTSSGVFY